MHSGLLNRGEQPLAMDDNAYKPPGSFKDRGRFRSRIGPLVLFWTTYIIGVVLGGLLPAPEILLFGRPPSASRHLSAYFAGPALLCTTAIAVVVVSTTGIRQSRYCLLVGGLLGFAWGPVEYAMILIIGVVKDILAM